MSKGYHYYSIHEIYCNDDGSVYARTEQPVHPIVDTYDLVNSLEEPYSPPQFKMAKILNLMLQDIQKYPTLEEPYQYAKQEGAVDEPDYRTNPK